MARVARLNHPFCRRDVSKALGCCKTSKPPWHHIRRRKRNNAGAVFGLFPSVFIKMKMRRRIRLPVKTCPGTQSVEDSKGSADGAQCGTPPPTV